MTKEASESEQHEDREVPTPSGIVLSSRQWRAAELDAQGKLTTSQIAEAVGVRRETLWRWRQLPEYVAAQQALRRELHQRLSNRFWHVQDLALDVVEESLKEGDPQMAIDTMRLGAPGIRDVVEITTPLGDDASTAASSADRGRVHELVEPAPTTFECPNCNKRVMSARGLTQHWRRMHPPSEDRDRLRPPSLDRESSGGADRARSSHAGYRYTIREGFRRVELRPR